jgi:GNAT superfamily N-acetyltransferase
MKIERLEITHLPEVLGLLGLSLQFPGKEEWFEWKHKQSPFGESPGFVAVDEGKVLGVRLFMPWLFRYREYVFRALRPVDTATHPDARGKGIFKHLTLESLEQLKGTYDFVFNTPNNQSYPGYRKMGWDDWVQCRSVYFPVFPLKQGVVRVDEPDDFTVLNDDCLRTRLDARYLRWRYQLYPVRFYQSLEVRGTGVAVDTIRKGSVSVLRVRDFWGDPACYPNLVAGACYHEQTWFAMDLAGRAQKSWGIKWQRPASRVVFRGEDAIRDWPVCFSLGDIDAHI